MGPLTVTIGADDNATRTNIQSVLNGISDDVQVTVIVSGLGDFNVGFNAPPATDIATLVFDGGGLAGAADLGISTITDGQPESGQSVELTSDMTPAEVTAALESLPFIDDVWVGGAEPRRPVTRRLAGRQSRTRWPATCDVGRDQRQRMERALDVVTVANPLVQSIPTVDIVQDLEIAYPGGTYTLGASDINAADPADQYAQVTGRTTGHFRRARLGQCDCLIHRAALRGDIPHLRQPSLITYFSLPDVGQAVPADLISGVLSLPLDLPGLTLKYNGVSEPVDLTSRVRRLNLTGAAAGDGFTIQYGVAPAVDFHVGGERCRDSRRTDHGPQRH